MLKRIDRIHDIISSIHNTHVVLYVSIYILSFSGRKNVFKVILCTQPKTLYSFRFRLNKTMVVHPPSHLILNSLDI